MTNARDIARDARQARLEALADQPADALTENRMRDLEATVVTQARQLEAMAETLQQIYSVLNDKIDALVLRIHANEMAISKKTIETLTRAQVARIMREEAPSK